jgi:polyisoprenoid-binding protein YceI
VIASLDKSTGALAFEAAVNNFSFSNPQMQQHFNGANWMNSTEFPKFTFAGKIDKPGKVKFAKNGVYKVSVTGNLTIKGISKPIAAPATITVKDGVISGLSNFTVKLKDYGITGQPIDAGKVAEKAKVKVSMQF